MKIFHLSDLHIGLKLMNRDLIEDQKYILQQIVDAAEEEAPDAVVVAGDIYDKAIPSAEAVSLFDFFLTNLQEVLPDAAIMMISGNHDSAPRLDCFREILARQNVYMIGLPPQKEGEQIKQVPLCDEFGAVHFYLLPFVKPSMVRHIVGTDEKGNHLSYQETLRALLEREEINTNERNVLVSHQFYLPSGKSADEMERMDSEIRTVGNIDEVSAELLKVFDYAALGHIHKPMQVGSEVIRYCGTPLACSVSEAGQQKGIIVVELGEKGSVKTHVHPLKPLREIQIIRGTLMEVLAQETNDYVSVILTDQEDLEVFDTRDRLRNAFPNLLEIRRETARKITYEQTESGLKDMDPYELCASFLGEKDEKEAQLLREILNQVMEDETE